MSQEAKLDALKQFIGSSIISQFSNQFSSVYKNSLMQNDEKEYLTVAGYLLQKKYDYIEDLLCGTINFMQVLNQCIYIYDKKADQIQVVCTD